MRDLMSSAMATAILLVPVMNILVKALKELQVQKRYLATLSIVLGTVIGIAFGLWLHGDPFAFGVAGFFAGGTASGLYDAIKGLTKGDDQHG